MEATFAECCEVAARTAKCRLAKSKPFFKVSESNKEVSSKEIRAEAKKNEVLEKALRRIEESRLKFSHLSEPSSNHISKGNVSSTKADAFKTKIQSFKTEEILKNAEENLPEN